MTESPFRPRLLTLARTALVARVTAAAPPAPPDDLSMVIAGMFVTIHCRGDLRGCLGTLTAGPLAPTLIRLAGDVAEHDVRFTPLEVGELAWISVELSLLTPPEPVSDLQQLRIGRDGLIVEQGRHRGLLLPQVAIDQQWDLDTFLAQTCVKAGLPPSAWRDGASVFRFEADVFGEDDEVRRA